MDDVMSRPTPDAQKELLDRLRNHGAETDDEALDAEFNVGWFFLRQTGTSSWDRKMFQ